MIHTDSTKCPKCNADSPLTDYCEVDIGVGFQRFDEEYTCPKHGDFAFPRPEGKVMFRDDLCGGTKHYNRFVSGEELDGVTETVDCEGCVGCESDIARSE